MIVTYTHSTREDFARETIRRMEDLWDQLPEEIKLWLNLEPGDWENRHINPDKILWNLVFGISFDEAFNKIPMRQRRYLGEPAQAWEKLAWKD